MLGQSTRVIIRPKLAEQLRRALAVGERNVTVPRGSSPTPRVYDHASNHCPALCEGRERCARHDYLMPWPAPTISARFRRIEFSFDI